MGGCPGEKKCDMIVWEGYSKKYKDKAIDSEAESPISVQPHPHPDRALYRAPRPTATPKSLSKST